MGLSHVRATLANVQAVFHEFQTCFVRQRKLGPLQIVVTLMTMIREQCGYRRGLSMVHEHHGEAFGWDARPDAGAFHRARRKLSVCEMQKVYDAALMSPIATSARMRWLWKGLRVLSADGTRLLLPASPAVIAEWGRPRVASGEAYQPQLLHVALWDVGAIQPLKWVNLPCHGKGHGERTAILQLLDGLGPGDVLLLDRGFPSRRLLFELCARKIHFVIRMAAGSQKDFAEVARFLERRRADADVDFTYRDPELDESRVERLRLVRVADRDGNVRVMVTNLADRTRFSRNGIFALYRRRWGIENAFRDLKIRYEAENFHGATPRLIEQEIVALMLHMLLESFVEETAIMALPAPMRPSGDDDRPLRCNRAELGDRLPTMIGIGLRHRCVRHLAKAFSRGIQACAANRTRVRRPRHCPRICRSQYGRWRLASRHSVPKLTRVA